MFLTDKQGKMILTIRTTMRVMMTLSEMIMKIMTSGPRYDYEDYVLQSNNEDYDLNSGMKIRIMTWIGHWNDIEDYDL